MAGQATRRICRRVWTVFWAVVRGLVLGLAGVSGLAVLVMIATTCTDVVLRLAGSAPTGANDIVRLARAAAIACAIPYTTAVKGHVAIEYFFHRLGRRGRIVVDTVARLLGMALFALLSWRTMTYGHQLRRVGQVSLTLEVPLFWVPYLLSLACALVVLVILHNLIHPGREMIKP